MSSPTLHDAIAAAVPRLEATGVEEARRDAEVLLCAALGCDRAHLIGHSDSVVGNADLTVFNTLLSRRMAREPVSQIVGCREFWSLEFQVTASTLTPRPDSEAVIEAVLDRQHDKKAALRILDLGTGTGCLLLALLTELPNATGVGVDVCDDAVVVAKANVGRCGLGARAQIIRGGWAAAHGQLFDIVVCNPPYIRTSDLARLDPEVADWEPHLALDGGSDGLDAYRRILPGLPQVLSKGGFAVLEHGAGQAGQIEDLAVAAGLTLCRRHQDLAGRDRCLVLKG